MSATLPPAARNAAIAPPTAGESFLLNLLASRAEHKDTRVFAHATAETQSALTAQHDATSRPGSRAAPLNVNSQEPGFLEVFPKVTSRPPRLLQELESILVDRLRCADKAAWPGMMLPKERDAGMAANLSLDAHRQVFAAFIQGFSTYSGMLAQIQAEFENALAEGLKCSHENVGLRVRMAEEAEQRLAAQQEVRSKILAEEVGFRQAAFAKLQETRERTARLTRRAAAAERELAAAREEQQRLQKLVMSLRATSAALAASDKAEATWANLPTSTVLRSLEVGPLTEQERAFLDQEYTGIAVHRQRAPGSPLPRSNTTSPDAYRGMSWQDSGLGPTSPGAPHL